MGVKEKIKSFYPIGNTAFYSFAGSGFAFAIILLFSMLVSIWNGEPIPTLCVVACGICIVIFVMSLIYIFTSWIYDYIKNRNDSIIENKVFGDALDGIGELALVEENTDKQTEAPSPEPEKNGSIIANQASAAVNLVFNQMLVIPGQKPELVNENAYKPTDTSSSDQDKTDNRTEENDTNNNVVNDSNEIDEIKEESKGQINDLPISNTEEDVSLQDDGDNVDNNEEELGAGGDMEQNDGEDGVHMNEIQKEFMTKYVTYKDECKKDGDNKVEEEKNKGKKNVYDVIKNVLKVSASDNEGGYVLRAACILGWICNVPSYADAAKYFGKENIESRSSYHRHINDNDKADTIKNKTKSLKANMENIVGSSNVYFKKSTD